MADQPVFDRPLEQLFVNVPQGSGVPIFLPSVPIVVPVPDLVGLSLEDAQHKLKQDTGGRLTLTEAAVVIEDGDENEVRAQNPMAGDLAPQGSSVAVTVRRNPDPQDPSAKDVLAAVAAVQRVVSALPDKTDIEVIVDNELQARMPDFRQQVNDALATSGLSAADVQKVQEKLDAILKNTGGMPKQ